ARAERLDDRHGLLPAAGRDREDDTTLAQGRLVPGQRRHLVLDAELHGPPDAGDEPATDPGGIDRVGGRGALGALDDPRAGLAGGERGSVRCLPVVEDREDALAEGYLGGHGRSIAPPALPARRAVAAAPWERQIGRLLMSCSIGSRSCSFST